MSQKSKFDEWFDGLIGFRFNSERFYDLLFEYDVTNKTLKRHLLNWLETAYNNGYEQGVEDSTPDSEFGEGSVC